MSGSRIIFLDLLKVVAMFFVVARHSEGGYYDNFGMLPESEWMWVNILHSIGSWAVPVFVMASGMMLLSSSKELGLSEFLKQRVFRLLLATIFWVVVGKIVFYIFMLSDMGLSLGSIMSALKSESFTYHLWFLFMLLGLYLILPVIKRFTQGASRNELLYFIILWFFSSQILWLGLFFNFSIKSYYPIYYFTGYLGYFVLGLFLGKVRFSRSKVNILLALSIVIFLTACFGALWLANNHDKMFLLAFDPYALPTISLSIAVFLFFKEYLNEPPMLVRRFTEQVSPSVFGIYVFHIFFVSLVFNTLPDMYPVLKVVLVTSLTYCIALLCAIIFGKIPILRPVMFR